MAKKRVNKGNKLFNKCAKQVRKDFKAQGNEISWNEAQKWTSQNVFQTFKGKDPNKVRIAEISKETTSILSDKPSLIAPPISSPCFNPLSISPADLLEVEWWNVNLSLEKLPPNLKVRLNGGNGMFGQSSLVENSLINFDLEVTPIIDSIRDYTNNESGLFWIPIIKQVPNTTDPFDPCNLFVDWVISKDGAPLLDDEVAVEPPQQIVKETSEEREKRLIQVNELAKARKKAQASKTRKRPTKKTPVIAEKPEKKKKGKKKKGKKKEAEKPRQDIAKVLELLREDFKDGILTKKEYKEESMRLRKLLESGGEI